ncbi:heavy metal translocating P-type ATPase [uncultured Clostridium sp.]|jgi:Cd2+/Zn2+-exporting ATPase|uniref:heavy metal translocating P-type ATPase n=1 Tax=uncultured Clostridium sp. TaxID=59620 RepID=UPI00260B5C7C|nr:heavy metal translocating P-type ATPase [uncultured Clostridium sp.]
MSEVKLYLDGLNCAGCARKIEDKTSKLLKVKEASLNFTTKTLLIELNDRKDEDEIISTVKDIIYKLEPDVKVREEEKNVVEKLNISKNFKLTLKDLNCAGCAGKIEEKTNALSEVKEATLNFTVKTLAVKLNDAKDIDKVKKEIRDIIFKLEPDVKVIDELEINYDEEIEISEEPKEFKVESSLNVFNITRFVIGVILFLVAQLSGFSDKVNDGIFVVSYVILGYPTVWKAVKNIFRAKNIFDENFLMTIASIGAFLIGEHPEAVAVIMFYEIGEMFQGYAVNNSRKSISSLMDIKPDFARVIRDNEEKTISPYGVKVDEIILVRAGERVPLDGVLIEGNTSLDTSALTGESVPRTARLNDEVLAGCINLNGVIKLRVVNIFKESTLSKILELVENAGNKKAPTEKFVTKFSRYYTPVVVIIAAMLAIVPPFILQDGSFKEWLERGLVFLVVSCPCALVVSIPLGFFGGIGAASKNGILIKGGNYLEALNSVKTVVFDKTGTLTEGKFKVLDIKPTGMEKEELLELAAYSEYLSNHPIAKSILEEFKGKINKDIITDYEEIAGRGISLNISDKKVLAGNAKLMIENNISYFEINEVGTIIYFAVDGEFVGSILIGDKIKDDSREAIKKLKALGIKTVMLTGDNKKAGEIVGKELGLDEIYTELLPQDKVERLENILSNKKEKENVIFVGDGINDAPVLARADIGIAMGGVGSDAAIEAADVVIMKDEPSKIIDAIKIAKRTRKIVWQNIIFALGIKLIVLVFAAGGMATMWEAVFADVGVAILAVLNAMRVLRVKK